METGVSKIGKAVGLSVGINVGEAVELFIRVKVGAEDIGAAEVGAEDTGVGEVGAGYGLSVGMNVGVSVGFSAGCKVRAELVLMVSIPDINKVGMAVEPMDWPFVGDNS